MSHEEDSAESDAMVYSNADVYSHVTIQPNPCYRIKCKSDARPIVKESLPDQYTYVEDTNVTNTDHIYKEISGAHEYLAVI